MNNSGIMEKESPVKGGIPIPEGLLQVEDISHLSIIDEKGSAVPAQFDPFVLWWGKDKSVKWLLVDMFADVHPNKETKYWIVKNKKQTKSDLKVFENEKVVEVVTGSIKAVISKQKGSILDTVYLDMNKDHRFSLNERLIKPDPLNGSIIVSDDQKIVYGESNIYNMWGTGGGRVKKYKNKGHLIKHIYGSGFGKPDKVVVETNGPVRATIRIEGRHWPQGKGDGIRAEGFYYYTVWLHFYAGKSFIKIEHSLDNNRKDYPMNIYRIKDLTLGFSLDKWAVESPKFIFGGEKEEITGELSDGYVSLFQDSANLNRWDLNKRLKGKKGDELKKVPGYFHRAKWKIGPAAFRGYKVVTDKTWPTKAVILGQGDHAQGWGDISTDKQGASIFVNHFWMECPKGIRLKRDRIEALLLPEFSPAQFQVHSSARKSHKITLNFHPGKLAPETIRNHSDSFRYPLLLNTDGEWYAKSLAWPRLLGISNDRSKNHRHWYPHFKWDKKIITARWKTTGFYVGFNQGGMHSNYWSIFNDFLRKGSLFSWEKAVAHAKWASEWIPWLIHDYSFSPDNTETHNLLVAYGPKKVYTNRESVQIKGWVNPYTTNIPAFTSPDKFHLDGEHLIHMWPFEWYYLTGSPIARDGLMAVGNQAKYSVHRNFFKSKPKYGGRLNPAPSLDEVFYFDDRKYPKKKPWYFDTRIYSSHLLSTAWTYAATGDPHSLFYAKWLVRRILYLHRVNGGVVGEKKRKRWNNIPPWQESEIAIAAFELYRETGDEELLDIMGSWLEWAYREAYMPGKGMPHRFKRGTKPTKFEHHWYPGAAAPACYLALGDPKALEMTNEWVESSLASIRKGQFVDHPAGQTAGYVITYLDKVKIDKTPPEQVNDLKVVQVGKDRITLEWTAPKDSGKGSDGSAYKYWVKYSDRPIVNHPEFPSELGKKVGFYQADNVRGETIPSEGGKTEKFIVTEIAPHGTYGSSKKFGIRDMEDGKYYFVVKSWDKAGNLSPISNMAEVEIKRSLLDKIERWVE